MHKVRTKMRPHEELEVSDQEYTDLQRQGMLVENDGKTSNRSVSASGGESGNRNASASGDK